ncbi:uncharacterized protein G2W53_038883 [Senna tora]|uniref:Uncharacterized protein n=1 Tax=Senna tora TaxID=362788 RepID=A0A834W2C4_9FABA|nr:uncharacterized protein G2W53_038883 [Senna tora]
MDVMGRKPKRGNGLRKLSQ